MGRVTRRTSGLLTIVSYSFSIERRYRLFDDKNLWLIAFMNYVLCRLLGYTLTLVGFDIQKRKPPFFFLLSLLLALVVLSWIRLVEKFANIITSIRCHRRAKAISKRLAQHTHVIRWWKLLTSTNALTGHCVTVVAAPWRLHSLISSYNENSYRKRGYQT